MGVLLSQFCVLIRYISLLFLSIFVKLLFFILMRMLGIIIQILDKYGLLFFVPREL